ncbi:MAG: putative transrane protein [Bradyrhizobium sp.]|nr:putative transrane protein [Bradyrhizobium sp.]
MNHRAESDLGPLRAAYTSARDELSEFKAKHRLKRAARSPSNRRVTIGLLIILVSVEAAANSIFFEKGSDLGLLGGLWTAVCISAVNVIIAFAIGLFPMRWTKHRNFLIACLGYAFAIIGFAALTSIHAIAAHLREVTAVVGEEAALLAAIESLKANPFGLKELNSYYLFLLGMVWAIVAAQKGFSFDDPYPGYGAHFRRAEAARQTYSYEHDNLFEDLEDIKEDTVRAIDAGITLIPIFPQQAATIRAEREALKQKFRGYEAGINTAANQLLSRYRDKNRIARSTPTPQYFDAYWQIPHSYLNDTAVQTELAEPPSQQMDPNQALEKLRAMSLAVLSEYNGLMSSYPHPTKFQ